MKNTIIALFALLLIASCAKTATMDTDLLTEQSFKAWLAKNDPDAVPLDGDEKIYIRFITHGPEESDSLDIVEYAWCRLNFSAYTFGGELVATRDSNIAKRAGTWVNTTHWCPQYVQLYEDGGFFCEGLHTALQALGKGDVARVYISSEYAYQDSIELNSGYDGTAPSYAGYPIYFDLEVGDVSHYVMATESDSVASYIAEWGLTLADSIGEGLYKRELISCPDGDTITKDTLLAYYYEEYFPDGFLIKTNVEDVAEFHNIEQSSADGVTDAYELTYSYCTTGANMYQCYIDAILSMRKGEKAEFITFSANSPYTNAGSPGSIPSIDCFQPIRFVVSVYDTTFN